MGRSRPGNIMVKFTRNQAIDLLNLIEDELESGEEDASDRDSLRRSAGIIQNGLNSLDARLKRMADYAKDDVHD